MKRKNFYNLVVATMLIVLSGIGCKSRSIESAEGFAEICTFAVQNKSSFFKIDSPAFNILLLVIENEEEKVKKDFMNLTSECKSSIHSLIKNQREMCNIAIASIYGMPASDEAAMCILYYVFSNSSRERSTRMKSLNLSQTRKIMNLLDL